MCPPKAKPAQPPPGKGLFPLLKGKGWASAWYAKWNNKPLRV